MGYDTWGFYCALKKQAFLEEVTLGQGHLILRFRRESADGRTEATKRIISLLRGRYKSAVSCDMLSAEKRTERLSDSGLTYAV